MKKNLLFTGFMFISLALNAQFTFSVEEETIENNSTVSFNTTDSDAKLEYVIHNETSSTIGLKAEVVEINGSDGSNFEFCFGICVPSVSEGMIIPQNSAVAVAANGSTNAFNHMWNKNSSSSLISYKIKFFQIEANGNPTGEPFFINYVYNENLGVYEAEKSESIKILNTVASNSVKINSKEKGSVSIYSAAGNLVKSSYLNSGLNILDTSNLKTGVYIVNIISENGKNLSEKIIIK